MQNQEMKQKVQNQFSRNAQKYISSETHANQQRLSLLVDWLLPERDWVILDIATGAGHAAKVLAPYAAHVFATDFTKGMLETARKHLRPFCPNVWYVIADAECLPFLDQTFDAIVCRIAAHHFPKPDQFVQEVSRVLKAGGKFLLIDNVAPGDEQLDEFVNTLEKLRDESHVRSYRVEEWNKWLISAGLVEEKSMVCKKKYDFPVWVNRTARKAEQIEEVQQYIKKANDKMNKYFLIEYEGDQIVSLQVDEWTTLWRKSQS
ncbi:class I SAM-dependent methyltransferase [Geobacillus subterraneus]|uniref:class I SAM-dependent methyltransferase n=1 Tax=Geobacillus subterraneus TaxID=129338 RepID=UPI00161BA7C6